VRRRQRRVPVPAAATGSVPLGDAGDGAHQVDAS
jgi:hypothetical protein